MEPMVLLTTLDERYLPQLQVLLTSLSIHNPGEKSHCFCCTAASRRIGYPLSGGNANAAAMTFHPLR